MDPATLSVIATSVTSLLTPYLVKITEKASEELGKIMVTDAWTKVRRIYENVKAKFAKRGSAKEALEDLEQSPRDPDIQAAFRVQLKKFMQEDDTFSKELADLLKNAAESNADTVFNTQIHGDVKKLVQMGMVFGDINF